MGTILEFLRDELVFEPEHIQAMATAYDDVCKTLNLSEREARAREVIATRIIELAGRGERSPTHLRDRVLREAGFEPSGAPLRRWSGM